MTVAEFEVSMAARPIRALLEDIRLLSEGGHAVVQAVRDLARRALEDVEEEVKYGGIVFSSGGVRFGGVFAYRQHVSVEFGHGASIADPYGHLEGSGKGRRHLKLRAAADIEAKHVGEYLKLGLQAAGGARSRVPTDRPARMRADATPERADLGFRYRSLRNGDVEILHRGRVATTLRGREGEDFVAEAPDPASPDAQQLMARLTGNYKRGNERSASRHPRNRR